MLVLWGVLFVCFSLKVRFAADDSQIIKALLKACFLNKKDRLHLGLDPESIEQSRYSFLLGLFTPWPGALAGANPCPFPESSWPCITCLCSSCPPQATSVVDLTCVDLRGSSLPAHRGKCSGVSAIKIGEILVFLKLSRPWHMNGRIVVCMLYLKQRLNIVYFISKDSGPWRVVALITSNPNFRNNKLGIGIIY